MSRGGMGKWQHEVQTLGQVLRDVTHSSINAAVADGEDWEPMVLPSSKDRCAASNEEEQTHFSYW